MLWIFLSFGAALSHSVRDVFMKKGLRGIDDYIIIWALRFFCALFLLPALLFAGIPEIKPAFYLAALVSGVLNTVTSVLYIKALKYSDLSIVAPLLAFSPLFLLVTSPIIVHEFPSMFGLIGIILIVFGAYTLNINQRRNGYFAPFKSLIKEKGPKYMLAIAFIWSISANFDKVAVQNSSPLFHSFFLITFIAIVLTPVMFFKTKNTAKQVVKNIKALIPIGFFGFLIQLFSMAALELALVAYIISIKRTSVIIGVFFGYLFFKEKNIRERLAGAVIMIAGVLLITLT